MSLPPVDQTYYAPEIETMPRADLEALQLERLLETLPHAYENSALLRTTWDAAGVHPRDVRTLDDFSYRSEERRQGCRAAVSRRARRPVRRPAVRAALGVERCELDVGHDGRSDARPRTMGCTVRRAVDHHARHVGLGCATGRLRDARVVHVPRADVRALPGIARHDADPPRFRRRR